MHVLYEGESRFAPRLSGCMPALTPAPDCPSRSVPTQPPAQPAGNPLPPVLLASEHASARPRQVPACLEHFEVLARSLPSLLLVRSDLMKAGLLAGLSLLAVAKAAEVVKKPNIVVVSASLSGWARRSRGRA